MGLNVSHGCFSAPYSAFNAWRVEIGKAAGRNIVAVDGIRAVEVNWDHITSDEVQGRWNDTPDDVLTVLFAHSDCDGVIQPAQAKPLVDALEGLLPMLDAETRRVAMNFIAGLRRAADKGENVEFT